MHHAVIDRLSTQRTFIHRLDARSKLAAALLFTIFVISLPPDSLTILIMSAAGPFAMLVLSGVPLKLAGLQILCLSPFVAVFALSMVFYEKTPVSIALGNLKFSTTTGVLMCAVILLKFAVTMMTLIVLSATTRFSDILCVLSRMHVPKILVMQIAILHRYIFIIIDRACNVQRARSGRKLKKLGLKTELKTSAAMLANIAAYSTDTAHRVSVAMTARGFNGTLEPFIKPKFTSRDVFFVISLGIYIAVLFLFKENLL